MAKYIPLDALLAEINKRIIDAPINYIGHQRVWAYNDVKDIIATLEVKEVDIDKLCEFRENIGFAYPEGASEYQKQLACYRQGIKDVIKALKGEEV